MFSNFQFVRDLKAKKIRCLSPEPRIGAHGKPVMFLHPKDCAGVLVELEQAWKTRCSINQEDRAKLWTINFFKYFDFVTHKILNRINGFETVRY